MRDAGRLAGRRIPLEGCHNFRDLGGYVTGDGRSVRRGIVFRSDALHELSPRDVRHLTDAIGLRAVIDLRSPSEASIDGIGPLPARGIAYHHVPLFDRTSSRERETVPDDLGELYFLMLRFAHERIGRVIELLAETPGPAVFHCAAGKDRTGVVAAVLLGLLGVEEQIIVADYAATAESLDRIVARLEASESYREIWDALPPETLHAEARTMQTLLARATEHWGSMRDYARAAGVPSESLERLRSRLLSDSS